LVRKGSFSAISLIKKQGGIVPSTRDVAEGQNAELGPKDRAGIRKLTGSGPELRRAVFEMAGHPSADSQLRSVSYWVRRDSGSYAEKARSSRNKMSAVRIIWVLPKGGTGCKGNI